MRPPAFWSRPPAAPGLLARVLAPPAALWAFVTRRRLARPPAYRATVPVICVGNISLGGTGKTPAVIALAQRLAGQGRNVQVISRGHGGSLAGPVRVDERRHSAAEVGDEPLLIAPFAGVHVGRNRVAGAQAAQAAGAGIILMDDGFQNPSLAKDISIVVVDAQAGFGNGRVIPSGPLRESVPDGLARADLVLIIGPEAARAVLLRDWPALAALPLMSGVLEPLPTGMDWQGLRALAFAGIGRPEKFFATLAGLGATIVARHAFDDHAPYDSKLLTRLEAEAKAKSAQLVTTEKDAVRLPVSFRKKVLVLPVRLVVADWGPFDAALARLDG